MIFLKTSAILGNALLTLTCGLILIKIQLWLPPRRKTTGLIASYGDSITISFITPMILKSLSTPFHLLFQWMVSPIGFLSPIYFAAASFITKPDESGAELLEKSRPSLN